MKIRVGYEGFNIRGRREYVPHSEKAEQLLKDYGFEYKIIDI